MATATMPTGLRQVAEYQPFTPFANTVRGPLSGAAIGDHAIAAFAWSIGGVPTVANRLPVVAGYLRRQGTT